MNFRKLILAGCISLAAIACKKDEEGTSIPGLDGYLSIKGLVDFIAPNTTLELTPEGVTHPDGGELSYTWKVTPSHPKTYTGETFKFTFTDTLQTCTVYCSASAEGYSGSSSSSYVTVVKGGKGGSIRGIDYPADSLTTEHGVYYYQQIGSQTWTINNMAEKGYGKAYRNAEIMSDVLGRFYNYNDAKAICSSLSTDTQTWALPTLEDWKTLTDYVNGTLNPGSSIAAALMADATFNSTTMWAYRPDVGNITNSSNFSAIPAGYVNLESSVFEGVYEYATFWTASESENPDEAHCVYLYFEQPSLKKLEADKKSFGASVRCIQK